MSRFIALLTSILAPLGASGAVVEWSGRTAGTDYVVTGVNSVELRTSGTFKFESVSGGALDNIDSITIASGVTGTVSVGTNLLNTINLGNVTGSVSVNTLGGTLTATALNSFAATTTSTGSLVVNGNLAGTVNFGGTLSGNITVHGNVTSSGQIAVGT